MNEKVRSLFSNLLNFSVGTSVPRSPEAREADGTHCQQYTLLLQGALTPTPTLTLRLGQFSRAPSPHLHVFGMREETRGPGATRADMGRMCKLHTHSGPSQKRYFSYQHYNERTLNKKLFKDLLYYLKLSLGL